MLRKFARKNYLVTLIASCALSSVAQADISPDQMLRLSVMQTELVQTQAPQVGNLTIDGKFNKLSYMQGEWASLMLNLKQPSNQTSYVALVQAYPDGRVVKLFPNRFQPNNQVLGSNRFEIRGQSPEGLYVNDQPGTYVVKLIASTDKQRLDNLLNGATQSSLLVSNLTNTTLIGSQGSTVWSTSDIAYDVKGAVVAQQPATPAPVPVTPVAPAAQPATSAFVSALQSFSAKKSDFNVSINLKNNQPVFRQGEPMTFQLTAEKGCNAGLIELDPTGALTVLYPNEVTTEVTLKSGQVSWLPKTGSKIQPLAGTPGEYAYLMVCTDKANFFEQLFGMGPKSRLSGFNVKPTVTVEELLKDDPDSWEGYGYTRVTVN